MIVINRARAEAATHARLRLERARRIAALDQGISRAIEAGVDTSSLVAEKHGLLNAPEMDLSALSLEQLASLTLDDALAL